MSALLTWATREAARHLAARTRLGHWAIILVPVGFLLVAFLVAFCVIVLVFFVVASQNSGGCGTSVPVGAPTPQTQTAGQVVVYFESQGISANGAAGITGNLEQESSLNPHEPGGKLAQWIGSRYQPMADWTASAGYPAESPDPKVSMAGQLMYVVYDLRTHYAALLAQLNAAASVDAAEYAFQQVYEGCGACMQARRQTYAAAALAAAQAAGGVVQASLATGGTCVALGGGGGDPIPGFRPGRDDMGVDGCASPGMPIVAPADSQLVEILGGWYAGQPLMLLRFVRGQAGAASSYWYVAEQIIPRSLTPGTIFPAGQPVATYAPSGTCVEIGWGSPKSDSRTLAGAIGRGGDAGPPAGTLTPEAESFKTYFHIPWIGRSA